MAMVRRKNMMAGKWFFLSLRQDKALGHPSTTTDLDRSHASRGTSPYGLWRGGRWLWLWPGAWGQGKGSKQMAAACVCRLWPAGLQLRLTPILLAIFG